jgi:hypothetical protein
LEVKTYFETGNAILPHCLKIMPLEAKKKFQKCKYIALLIIIILVCIGNSTSLLYYEYKKGEMIQDFKSES